jgi:glycosidase
MAEPWWKRAVVYHVYVRSLQDTDGDGVGDLEGVEQRLDYFAWLGVDVIWLSPIYPSPLADFGYDVSDHCDIDPGLGALEDFDRLIAAAHARGLRLILDFVPNHTSDRHPWFLESRASRASHKRDWFIWRDPAPDGGPPNNWRSNFGGSSWQWDATTGQYYLHAFLKQQPDLNWRNPQVREAMFDVLRFWLERGVDGFRIDVLWHIVKAESLADNPPNPAWRAPMGDEHRLLQHNSTDQPEAHDIAAGMRRLVEQYPGERLLIGEIYLPVERLVRYYGPAEAPEVHLPFNFQLIGAPWDARVLHRLIADYEAVLPPGAWPNWVLGNHDRPRIAARVGEAQARVAAMLLLTLRGVPTLYYGDELGIGRVDIPADRVVDPWELNEPGRGLGRDPVRTPMAWDDGPHAGFSRADPWLPLHGDWPTRNVARQAATAGSMLDLYRHLLALRRAHDCLSVGDLRLLAPHPHILAYTRGLGDAELLIALNLSATAQPLALPDWARGGDVIASTLGDAPGPAAHALALRPDEGVIVTGPRGERRGRPEVRR